MKTVTALALASPRCCSARATVPQRTLTACADPNNLPFSNRAGQGFENKLAEMIAADLHARLEYVWWAQRRGYVRNTLNERKMRLLAGHRQQCRNGRDDAALLPLDLHVRDAARRDKLQGLTLDDPRLKKLRIGVQLVGDDASNTPPAHALARRGIVGNVRGYMLYGDYSRPNPPADDRPRRSSAATSTSRSSGVRSPAISRRNRRCRCGSSR